MQGHNRTHRRKGIDRFELKLWALLGHGYAISADLREFSYHKTTENAKTKRKQASQKNENHIH